MRYCTGCGTEYVDSATRCSDCPEGTELLPRDEFEKRGFRLPHERDTRRFVPAGTSEDPLTTERLTALLEQADIPVFARPRRGGSVDALTGPNLPWWELLVPEEAQARAAELIQQAQAELEASAEEAARAAEQEELETEAQAVKP